MTRGVSKGSWLGSYPRDSSSTLDPATIMGLSLAGKSNRLINDRGWVRLPKSLPMTTLRDVNKLTLSWLPKGSPVLEPYPQNEVVCIAGSTPGGPALIHWSALQGEQNGQ